MNLALDSFYDYKLSSWLSRPQEEPGFYANDEVAASRFAARWSLIPLTRAIDTLLLQIGHRDSVVKRALTAASGAFGGCIELIRL